MSLWRSYKPVICKAHGYAVAGGSDIALCCDLVVMEQEARIGYPPARVLVITQIFERKGLTFPCRVAAFELSRGFQSCL